MPLRVLSASDVRQALPMRTAIDAMRVAFGQLSAGEVDLPLRTAIDVPKQNGVALVMSARCEIPLGLGGKFVTVFPENPGVGRSLIHAAVLLLSPETGEVVALLEGMSLTAIRTGAASGLATDLLARPDATRVGILGSGVQARTQLEAVCCVRDVESVWVYSPTRAHATRFAKEMAELPDVPVTVRVASSAQDAVRDADVVCTATTSSDPVLSAGDVQPGAHINGVGSFTPQMREIAPELLGRARVVVDQREAALTEAGEVIAAVRDGLLKESTLVELGEIVNGSVPGRTPGDQITVFKSVGVAVQDLCAAARAVEAAEEQGIGTTLPLHSAT